MSKKNFFRNIDLTAQNKLILTGIIVSTLLIVFVAIISIGKIQEKLYDGYSNFGQLLTKTLAIQTSELTRNLPPNEQVSIIKNHANSILLSNKDISYISFKDAQGNIIYSTAYEFARRAGDTKINISSPMNNGAGKTVGVVEIGLSADMAGVVAKTTKNSMLVVFTLVWIVFTLVVVVNTFLIARELTLLHHGVKEISSGKFGTVLDYSQASGEIKELFSAFNDMSKRLHAYEEQNVDTLTLEKNKLEAILMSIANGVVVCDSLDKITLVNNAAQTILGAELKEILNSHIQNYCDSNGEVCFKDKITLFKNTPLEIIEKKPLEFNVSIDKRVVKSIISPIYSKAHDYLGYIIILIDITKEAEVDKLKNDFISNVSHELRTPVTVLRSYADTLYNFGDNFDYNEQREFIGTINQEVIRLNKMVNDVLDFSKLQNDTVLEKEYRDITRTIERTINSLRVLADEKNITFAIIKEPDIPRIPYNEDSIERVLSNLITNAIKYSHENSRIKVRAEIGKKSDFVEISIEDFGVGIAQEHLEKIFDRFYRIENEAHTIKGTGLGLHLVKIAVEKHHQGKVFVTSNVGEGSIFGFRLPMNESSTIISDKEIDPSFENSFSDEAISPTKETTSIKPTFPEIVPMPLPESMRIHSFEFKPNVNEEGKLVEEVIETPQEKISEQTSEKSIDEIIAENGEEEDWEISFEIREKA